MESTSVCSFTHAGKHFLHDVRFVSVSRPDWTITTNQVLARACWFEIQRTRDRTWRDAQNAKLKPKANHSICHIQKLCKSLKKHIITTRMVKEFIHSEPSVTRIKVYTDGAKKLIFVASWNPWSTQFLCSELRFKGKQIVLVWELQELIQQRRGKTKKILQALGMILSQAPKLVMMFLSGCHKVW